MPTRLSPIASPATDVILVGDPRRSFLLAQELTEGPKMSHLARGLWGYTGGAPSGRPVTIQATGIGGPSAAAVIGDLVGEGVSRIIRLGTCFGLDTGLAPGSVILVTSVLGLDGLSIRMGDGSDFTPDPALNSLLEGIGMPGRVSSHDLLARNEPEGLESKTGDSEEPVTARDLQTAATFAVARRLSVPAAALLVVVESESGERLGEAELEEAFVELGRRVLDRISPAERRFEQV